MNDKEDLDQQIEQLYQQRKAIKDKLYQLLSTDNINGASAQGLTTLGIATILHEKRLNIFEDLREFTKMMGLPLDLKTFPYELQAFRDRLLKEEVTEYEDAVLLKQKEKQLDALIDIIYVATGTIIMHGWDGEEAWRRVHNANMKKYPGMPGEGKQRAKDTGMVDAIKPEGWKAPKLIDLL